MKQTSNKLDKKEVEVAKILSVLNSTIRNRAVISHLETKYKKRRKDSQLKKGDLITVKFDNNTYNTSVFNIKKNGMYELSLLNGEGFAIIELNKHPVDSLRGHKNGAWRWYRS